MHHDNFLATLLALILKTSTAIPVPGDSENLNVPPNTNILGCYHSPPLNPLNRDACNYLLDTAVGRYMDLATPGVWESGQSYSWNLAGANSKYAPNSSVLDLIPTATPVTKTFAPSVFVAIAKTMINGDTCKNAGGVDFVRADGGIAWSVRIYTAQTQESSDKMSNSKAGNGGVSDAGGSSSTAGGSESDHGASG